MVFQTKRKLIQLASSSLVVSMPKQWVKEYHLKKGDSVSVSIIGSSVVVSPEEASFDIKKSVEISALSKHMIEMIIISAYRAGYSELTLTYSKPFCKDLKSGGRSVEIPKLIRNVVSNLIGFEVVKQTAFSSIIKEVASSDSSEFESLFRRTFLLALDYTTTVKDVLFSKSLSQDTELLTLKRLLNYCVRLLRKKGRSDYEFSLSLFPYLYALSDLVETYSFILLFSSKCRKLNNSLSLVFDYSNSLVRLSYEFYYSPSKDKLKEYYSLRRRAYTFINNLRGGSKLSRCGLTVLDYLALAVAQTGKLIDLKLSM